MELWGDTGTGVYILASLNLLAAVLCLVTAIVIWQKRSQPIAVPLSAMFLAAGLWGIFYSVELAEIQAAMRFSWMIVKFMIIPFAALATSILVVRFAGWPAWPRRAVLAGLLILPILSILALATNNLHSLFWTSFKNVYYPLYDVLVAKPGPLFWAHVVYSYGLILASLASASAILGRMWQIYRKQTVLLAALLFLPMVFRISYVCQLSPIPGVDLTPLGFGASAVILLASRKLDSLVNVAPFAHFGAVDQITDSVLIIDSQGRIIELNDSATRILADGQPSLIGKKCSESEHPILVAMHHAEKGNSTPREVRVGSPERPNWYELRISPLNGPDGRPAGWMGVWHEITQRKQLEADLLRTSVLDQLTGLHNRLFFEEEFLRIGRGRIWPVAVIMGDLDNLKTTNDQKGHPVGDDLLRHTADVFRGCLRGGDLVARIGGDEFVVVLPGCGQPGADSLIHRLKAAFAAHNLLHPNLPIEISLGYAVAEMQETLPVALQDADKAMYIEKNRRKGFPESRPVAVKHSPSRISPTPKART